MNKGKLNLFLSMILLGSMTASLSAAEDGGDTSSSISTAPAPALKSKFAALKDGVVNVSTDSFSLLPLPDNVNYNTSMVAGTLGILGTSLYLGSDSLIAAAPSLSNAFSKLCCGLFASSDFLKGTGVTLGLFGFLNLYKKGPELRKQLVSAAALVVLGRQFKNPGAHIQLVPAITKGAVGVAMLGAAKRLFPFLREEEDETLFAQ